MVRNENGGTRGLALLAALLAFCSCTATDPDPGLVGALRAASTAAPPHLHVESGTVTGYAVPMPPATIPAAARRTAEEFIQPGGEAEFVGREWRASRSGYRFVTGYASAGGRMRRSVLVDAEGTVLERSHEIALAEIPAPARAAAAALGEPQRVEVLQGTGADRYRFEVVDAAGRRRLVVCEAGVVVERWLLTDARVSVRETP